VGDHLTGEQHARLASELAELEGPKRQEIVDAIRVARGHGDLSENFEYHAAKNEQALLERRIAILRDRLNHAQIVEEGAAGVVSVGSHLVVEDEAGERIEVELSAVGGAGTVSPSSPLGAAVLGKRVGETVDVQAPRVAWRATIVAIRGASDGP
jgi:transcription elongation factor GreA